MFARFTRMSLADVLDMDMDEIQRWLVAIDEYNARQERAMKKGS